MLVNTLVKKIVDNTLNGRCDETDFEGFLVHNFMVGTFQKNTTRNIRVSVL